MPDIAVKKDTAPASKPEGVRHPLLSLREEVNRLCDDFFHGSWLQPFGPAAGGPERGVPSRRHRGERGGVPHTAELPGMTERDVEVTLAGAMLTVKGEKREEKEECL